MPDPDSATVGNNSLPLCVDLDGTLLLTDSLWESCLRLLTQNPFLVFLLPFWLLAGKAGFKHKVASHVDLDATTLPYNTELLKYLTHQKLENRHLTLVTAANESVANKIANHLNIFDEIYASTETINLSGSKKARLLTEKYGENGFVYAGNARIDTKVWQHADSAITVNTSNSIKRQAKTICPIEADFPTPQPLTFKTILKAIRIHQWTKNLLIFVPLFLAHGWHEANDLMTAAYAFLSFSFAASSIYIFNDLVDLESDRTHSTKRKRPLASGAMPIQTGIVLIPLLLATSFLLSTIIGINFLKILLIYLGLTTIYSLFLKQQALLDVITLTSLYSIRILAGAIAVSVPVSYWLIAFSMFIFLSLALIKRFSELKNLVMQGKTTNPARGYHSDDLEVISLFGISSGYISIMILVLYIHDLQANVIYSNPDWLWFVAISVLYWISHMWLLAFRGQMNEDPIMFALHDRPSYITTLVVVLCLFLAL